MVLTLEIMRETGTSLLASLEAAIGLLRRGEQEAARQHLINAEKICNNTLLRNQIVVWASLCHKGPKLADEISKALVPYRHKCRRSKKTVA